MAVPEFFESELTVIGEEPGMFCMPPSPVYSYPVTKREAVLATLRKEPYWQIYGIDFVMMTPRVNPDNHARGFVFEAERLEPVVGRTVPDMFGIQWEYIPEVMGSMVRPGKPFAEDAHDLLKKIVWPDPAGWDWEASAKLNNGTYFKKGKYNYVGFLNGWFERLISMLDFEGALMAIYDEDQKSAVEDFFDKLSDLYISIFSLMIDAYPDLDGFSIHDDWGGQKDTFFSPELCAEIIVPFMRRVTDYLHGRGKICELHSCGNIMKQVPNMIKAGWDLWFPQTINDTWAIYDKYGGDIIIGVDPKIDPEGQSDDDMRAAARSFADKFMQPEKPCIIGYSPVTGNRAFTEEMYILSRKKCCGIH